MRGKTTRWTLIARGGDTSLVDNHTPLYRVTHDGPKGWKQGWVSVWRVQDVKSQSLIIPKMSGKGLYTSIFIVLQYMYSVHIDENDLNNEYTYMYVYVIRMNHSNSKLYLLSLPFSRLKNSSDFFYYPSENIDSCFHILCYIYIRYNQHYFILYVLTII